MANDRIVNRDELKKALIELRKEYGDYWEKNSEKVIRVYRKFVDRVLEGEDPRNLESELQEKYRDTLDEYRDIDKLFWFRFGVANAGTNLKDESVEKFREFIKEIKNARSEDEAWRVFEQYKNAISGLRTVPLSTWVSILQPEIFIPLWLGRNRGIININNVAVLV